MKFFLVLFASFLALSGVKGMQDGTIRIGKINPDNDYYCETVTFPTAFTGVDPVKVFTSIGFGTNSSRVHDVVFTWVESVTTSSFKVCLVENGVGSDGDVTINWMAYQSIQSGVTDGSVRLNDWTTGTECKQVIFSHNFPSVPHIFVSAHHNVLDKKQDAATVWVEGITRNDFTVCMREARTFDGRHKDIDVTWMAMTEVPQTWNYHDFIRVDFPNTLVPSEADNDAFCQVVSFNQPYFDAPTIVVAPSHEYDSSDINAIHPEHNSIAAWVEETTRTNFKTCVKDLVGLDNKHHPIEVDYIVFGDLDPCINKTCDFFGVCQATSANAGQCECITQCPSYQDLVCASNGRTFDNMCALKREICQTRGNYSYYHPGGCQGFPFDKGTHHLSHVSAESYCEVVSLQPYAFYPHKPIHVQLTVNYINASLPTNVHDATVTWSEKVNPNNFTVCMTKTGRNDQPTNDVASVDWIAYQGSPNGALTGKERITQWWTGTKCTTLAFPSGKFTGTPTVLVTLEHQRDGLKHDAASVWVEDISSSSFQVCIRELQNFDGIHKEIDLDWMAFETLHLPLFSEHGSVHFANTQTPLESNNYAFCEVVNLAKTYTRRPSVLITATHDTSVGLSNPTCNGISAWIENITLVTFRVCLKELYSDRYDPVTLQYAVVSDMCGKNWNYFNGFCYKTTPSCASWNAAQSNCIDVNSNLASVTSQEENTYIQHRHSGDTGWIGLQDIDSEGNFTWIDGTNVTFTYWAANQPNGHPGDQDCVHTLGLRHDYHWNDVTCGSCHAYTCKRDIDECSSDYHVCGLNAQCTNSDGSYTCVCNSGYTGDGTSCLELDECSSGVHTCDSNAQCTNTVGSYTCSCLLGFNGDGRTCSDIDECSSGSHSCNGHAQCTNAVGTYNCQCNPGFHGDGWACTDVDECTTGSHSCDANAQCSNNLGSHACQCNHGFNGNGYTCSDVDECSSGAHTCNVYAQCTNTVGSYSCHCNSGYQGNGHHCSDIDECSTGSHSCYSNAHCINNMGSYTCQCDPGYQWDGSTCTDIDECTTGPHGCHANGRCANTIGSYTCQCNSGYYGDGYSCTSVHVSVQTDCNYTSIDDRSGHFESPNYPLNYLDNQNCYWTLTFDARITISFESFHLEDTHDHVRIYDGDSSGHTLLGEFSGISTPSPVSSSSNQLYITFSSDDSVTRSGFRAKYDASIRLVGSSNNYEGRLEVYHNSQWGTVCDDIWDSDNNGATVACSQLGFSGVQSYNTKTFGEGIDPIWLDDVTCNGNETRIQDCSRYGGLWGNHNCAHSEDVGIICSP